MQAVLFEHAARRIGDEDPWAGRLVFAISEPGGPNDGINRLRPHGPPAVSHHAHFPLGSEAGVAPASHLESIAPCLLRENAVRSWHPAVLAEELPSPSRIVQKLRNGRFQLLTDTGRGWIPAIGGGRQSL